MFILYCPVYDKKFGDEWPLSPEEDKSLDFHQPILVEKIEPDELINQLYSKAVITERQHRALTHFQNPDAKSELLIEILRRSSRRNYQLVIECLNLTGQPHVAELLKKGGGKLPLKLFLVGSWMLDVWRT